MRLYVWSLMPLFIFLPALVEQNESHDLSVWILRVLFVMENCWRILSSTSFNINFSRFYSETRIYCHNRSRLYYIFINQFPPWKWCLLIHPKRFELTTYQALRTSVSSTEQQTVEHRDATREKLKLDFLFILLSATIQYTTKKSNNSLKFL